MAFPDDVVKTCFEIVDGKCECRGKSHNHPDGRCNKELVWENRGREGHGAWEAHHIDGNPEHNTHTNCEILCWDCHSQTF